MTEVLTLPNGLSAEEVEKLVTVPTEYGMSGMLHLERDGVHLPVWPIGHSLYFDWDSDYYWTASKPSTSSVRHFAARDQAGISPENPIGEIYRYTVQGADHDLIKEKQVEDWIWKSSSRRCKECSTFGLRRTYQGVPRRARSAETDLLQHPALALIAAIQNSNTNSGGNYLNVGEQAFDVRGIGLSIPE